MNREKIFYIIIGGIIGGVSVGFIMSNFIVGTTSTMMGNRGASQHGMRNAAQVDQHFIEQMIPHHEDAITMAKLAQAKAKTPEVKQLAEDILRTQSAEINQMKAWYKEWFGRELPTGAEVMQHHGMMSGGRMHMGMMGDESDIERLESAENFDRTFVEEMIPHHQMAVMMASMLKNSSERPEMKKLADNIITAQSKEIESMRTWLKEWDR